MKPLYFIIVLVILTGGLFHQVFLPLYTGDPSYLYQPSSGYKTLKQNILDYQVTLDKSEKILKQSKELQDSYTNFPPSNSDLLNTMVPDSISKVKLHSEMASILRDANFPIDKLGLVSKSISPIPGTGAYGITFSLQDASYEKLKDFVYTLERSKRLLVIKSISVNPAEKVGEEYKFDIEVETYYMDNPNISKN